MLNHIFCSFHSPGGKHLCLCSSSFYAFDVQLLAFLSLSHSLNKVSIRDVYIAFKASFSLLVNHDKCSISVVCFNRFCLLVMMILPFTRILFVLLNIQEHHLEFVSIHQYDLADIIIKKTCVYAEITWEIKGKVQWNEYRQISEHATISIEIVRVCTRIVYGNFEVKVCFRSRSRACACQRFREEKKKQQSLWNRLCSWDISS